jgi:alpha-L-rhamnosidase
LNDGGWIAQAAGLDGNEFTDACFPLASAINRVFFNADNGTYSAGTAGYRQTVNVLPLAFGIAPEGDRRRVVESLVADIGHRSSHHDCGCLGVSEVLGVLTEADQGALAMAVVTNPTAPSWAAWMAAGESTMLESWDNAFTRSRGHFFMGTALQWVVEAVVGLSPIEGGWREFRVWPRVLIDVGRIAWRFDSPRGTITVAWSRDSNGMRMNIGVPVGATAKVRIPLLPGESASSGEGLEMQKGPGWVECRIFSGTWNFETARNRGIAGGASA